MRTGNIGVESYTECTVMKLNAILFASDTVLIADNERDLQNFIEEFYIIFQRQKVTVNVKSKVMAFEREICDENLFGNPCIIKLLISIITRTEYTD